MTKLIQKIELRNAFRQLQSNSLVISSYESFILKRKVRGAWSQLGGKTTNGEKKIAKLTEANN